jgi:DNA-directed RNA polymerase subunit RPC12/RpoP
MPQVDKEERKLYNKQYYQKRKMCEHGRRKDRCKECGGVGICEHDRQKYRCVDCGGKGICEHNKRKERCKECGGNEISKKDDKNIVQEGSF